MNGFFQNSEYMGKKPLPLVPQCGACGLLHKCNTPKIPVYGKGKKKILLISEMPGKIEDQKNKHYQGNSGTFLKDVLEQVGIYAERDCWLTYSIICRPPKGIIPSIKTLEWCRPNLINLIDKLQPLSIVLMGSSPIDSIIKYLWKETIGASSRWMGTKIPVKRFDAWLFPVWNPTFVIRSNDERFNNKVMNDMYVRHFERVARTRKKPVVLDNLESKITVIYEPSQIVKSLDWIKAAGKPISFDYETDRLKPDNKEASIVSCSVSNGDTTIAFPWGKKEVVSSMSDLLKSDLPKLGWNIKFEERWTQRILGHSVRNWIWDGMLGTHIEDCRPGITGLKYQAFVELGITSYDDHIKPFLQSSSNSNSPNRIKEIRLDQLLLYNGIDSYLEHLLCLKQMKRMKRGTV